MLLVLDHQSNNNNNKSVTKAVYYSRQRFFYFLFILILSIISIYSSMRNVTFNSTQNVAYNDIITKLVNHNNTNTNNTNHHNDNDKWISGGGGCIISNHSIEVSSSSSSSVCEESFICRPMEQVQFHISESLHDFLEGPALIDRNNSLNDQLKDYDITDPKIGAICLFQHKLKFSNHFPHAMQQLYRCISWWLLHSNMQWILVFDNDINRKKGRTSLFMKGFIQSIQDVYNVTIVSNLTLLLSSSTNNDIPPPYVQIKDYQSFFMHSPKTDAPSLRKSFIEYYNLKEINDRLYNLPRIAILDRTHREKRYIANVNQLQISLLQLLNEMKINNNTNEEIINRKLSSSSSSSSSSSTFKNNLNQSNNNIIVPIQYFNNKTLIEQITFFINTDIIISPHGAQLTGLSFMPNNNNKPCSVIYELFPKNYFIPLFFGTLCNVSNIQHYYMYLSNTDGYIDYNISKSLKETRISSRNTPICPLINNVVDSVRILIKQWQKCYYNNDVF